MTKFITPPESAYICLPPRRDQIFGDGYFAAAEIVPEPATLATLERWPDSFGRSLSFEVCHCSGLTGFNHRFGQAVIERVPGLKRDS